MTCVLKALAPTVATIASSLLAPSPSAAIPAFPGAEGPGANATGGRGGDVYHVTNLEFDLNGVIPGSLMYGIKNAPSAGRIIVFDVGGTIYQDGGGAGWWFRSSKSNITIAGQTAPGPGITIAGVGTKWTGSNVILRNITVRPNKDPVNPSSYTYDAFSLQLKNSIVDHVTATWYTDEGISLTDAGENTTVQYALIGEGLNYNGHSYGSIIATEVDGTCYSYHHNLYAHNNSRMPRIGSEVGTTGAVLDFTNNVIYNWINKAGYSGASQPSSSNFIGNYYIKGNNNGVTVFDSADVLTRIFQSKDANLANKADYDKDGVLYDGVAFGPGDTMPNGQKYYAGTATFVSTPFNIPGAGTPDPADVALQRVLEYGGANWQNRNPIDQRIIDSVKTGTGSIINDLTGATQAAEWATVMAQRPDASGNAPFTRPADFDTDNDGMPNWWEAIYSANGSGTAMQYFADDDGDGYTNIEEYINEIAEFPAPRPIEWTGGTGRFALITNWSVGEGTRTTNWQPGKLDTANINSGMATVDARGQRAGTLNIGTTGPATLTLTNNGWLQVEHKLEVGNSGTVNLVSGTLRVVKVLRVRESGRINFNGGKLDIKSGAAIFDYVASSSPLAALRDQIISGCNGGLWNGAGIISSSIALYPGTSIGIAEAGDLGITSFAGQTVDSTTVLIRFTYVGDSDLDGDVDNADFGQFFSHFQQTGQTWFTGDFDYDGDVDNSDFGLFFATFNLPPLGAVLPDLQTPATPEPAILGPLGLGLTSLLARRKRT